jgi:DNA-directed RNA polymerase specialized sigma24 family protein
MAAVRLASALDHSGVKTVEASSDKLLLERYVAEADRVALKAVVCRHARLVLGACRRVLGEGSDADHALCKTFALLERRAAVIRKQPSVIGWLHGTAVRQSWKTCDAADETVFAAVLPVSSRQRGLILDEELQRLPADYRDALMICHIEGLSYEVAAPQLSWPAATVRSRLHQARQTLSQRLERRGLRLSPMGLVIALADLASAPVPTALLRAALRHDVPAPILCCS